jgi:hypothetical protein
MTRPPYAVPLQPDYSAVRARASDALVRAIVAKAHNVTGDHRAVELVARELFPGDEAVQLVLRGATTPATTTGAGWAAELATTAVADLVLGLGPASAASELFRRSVSLSFGQAAALSIPGIVVSGAGITFVGEGQPMPVRQFLIGGPQLTPHKLPIAVTLTREMFQTGNAERLVRRVMEECLSAALDAHLFDAVAGDEVRPAGLRHGVAGLTPTLAVVSKQW